MALRRNVRCALFAALFGALMLFSGSVSADGDDDHSPVECKLEYDDGSLTKLAKKTAFVPLFPWREDDRATLEAGVGGEDNIVLSVLKESDGNVEKELMSLLTNLDISFLISVVGPLCLAILLLLVWSFCCWTCCPFCKCCRVGARQRKPNTICKIVVALLGGGLIFAVVVAAGYGIAGYEKSVDGFNSMVCTSKNTVNTIVHGNEEQDPKFIGINPIVTKLTAISDSLGPDADFMTEVNRIIDDTTGLTDAVNGMATSLTLLNTVMTTDLPAEILTNLHSCAYCTAVGESAQTASDTLAKGLAKSVSDARTEVKAQLNTEKSAELQAVVQDAIAPLSELEDMVENAFGDDVQKKMKDISNVLEREGKLGVSVLIILALTLAVSMFIVFLWYIFKQGPVNNPSYVTHRMAACTWCCGWFYAFLALWISGLLTLVNVPLCGLCLIMDDLNEDLLNEIRPSLIRNSSDPGAEDRIDMAINLVSQCFVPTDPDANPKLLDIITYTDDDGLTQPVRKRIVDDTVDKINEQFDSITGQSAESLEKDKTMSSFIQMLSNNDVSLLILADGDMCRQTEYQYMCGNEDLVGAAFPCGVSCQSGTPQDVPDVDVRIGGINDFMTKLETFGTKNNDHGCANEVTCDPSLGAVAVMECESGNQYMTLKQNIRALNNFRCDVWEDPADPLQKCDVKDMTETTVDGKTTWTNTCQNSDGVMTVKQVDCDIDAFDAYVKDWGTRITKLSRRVDRAANETVPEIMGNLKNAVDEYLLDPMLSIVNMVTCGFFAVVYDEVIDSLCFKGVVGFKQLSDSYVACGVLAIFMTALVYGVWRHSIDNVNAAKATARE